MDFPTEFSFKYVHAINCECFLFQKGSEFADVSTATPSSEEESFDISEAGIFSNSGGGGDPHPSSQQYKQHPDFEIGSNTRGKGEEKKEEEDNVDEQPRKPIDITLRPPNPSDKFVDHDNNDDDNKLASASLPEAPRKIATMRRVSGSKVRVNALCLHNGVNVTFRVVGTVGIF